MDYVERATTLRIMRVEQVIGGRAPLHVTAAGKLFLADNGAAACRDYSERTGLPARTPRSIADPERLCRSVRDISRQGMPWTTRNVLGVGCIGTPVRNASGRLVARLSLSLAHRTPPGCLDSLGSASRHRNFHPLGSLSAARRLHRNRATVSPGQFAGLKVTCRSQTAPAWSRFTPSWATPR